MVGRSVSAIGDAAFHMMGMMWLSLSWTMMMFDRQNHHGPSLCLIAWFRRPGASTFGHHALARPLARGLGHDFGTA
jgi:hypothetical protein